LTVTGVAIYGAGFAAQLTLIVVQRKKLLKSGTGGQRMSILIRDMEMPTRCGRCDMRIPVKYIASAPTTLPAEEGET
jgi:hypothetical protein